MVLKKIFLLLSLLVFSSVNAQNDTIVKSDLKFNYKQLIIPTALIGYGVIALDNHELLGFNTQIRTEIKEHIDEKVSIDDFSQYAPAATVYVLNTIGVEGNHNLKDRSIILGTSYLVVAASINALKYSTKVERPDGSSFNSFPSGHTATAFAGAEFLWQEYKGKSYWYGISGYLVASGTGMYRMLNNRHWFTDVACGAGIGILSTKVAYWTFPYVNKLFTKKSKTITAASFAPFYTKNQSGIGAIITIH